MNTTNPTQETLSQHASRLQKIATDLGLPELGETIVEDTQRRLDEQADKCREALQQEILALLAKEDYSAAAAIKGRSCSRRSRVQATKRSR